MYLSSPVKKCKSQRLREFHWYLKESALQGKTWKTGLPRNTPTPFSDHLGIPEEYRRLCDTASESEFEHDRSFRRGAVNRYRNQCQYEKKSFRQHGQNAIGLPMHSPA